MAKFTYTKEDGSKVNILPTAAEVGAVPTTEKGAANGVATLGSDGKVPSAQLPAFVDDVLEYNNLAAFPATGEASKIYIAKDTNKTYRWGGSAYVVISDTIALGETAGTAYEGSKGKALADAIGTLSSLTTSVKTSIVAAINALVTLVGTKVDKVTGKGLSTNDFTDAYKSKLDGVDGSNVFYATTATAIGTAAKVVTGLPAAYVPAEGDTLNLYMQLGNSVASPTLSINSTAYPLQFRDVALTGSANYTIPAKQLISVVFRNNAWQFTINPDWTDDNTTTVSTVHLGGNVLQAGAAVNRYKLALEGVDGKFYEACTGDTNALTKPANTQTFQLGGKILFYSGSAAKAANGYFGSDGQQNYYYSSANLNYTFNGFAHCTGYRPLYLKGKVQSGGGFKLDATSATSWYTTELPTTADGFIYIKVGAIGANNATVFTLFGEHPIFEFQNGHIRPYCPIKLTLSGTNLDITEE
jgi:hypothetical protein